MRAALVSSTIAALTLVLAFWACDASDPAAPASDAGSDADSKPDAAGVDAKQDAPLDSKPDVVLPDGGLPPGQSWLADPKIWKAVPGTEFIHPYCSVFEADSKALQFEPLAWKPCGPGCELADVTQGYGDWATFARAGTVRDGANGIPMLASQHGIPTSSYGYTLLRVTNLETQTIAAAQLVTPATNTWSYCSFGGSYESALPNVLLTNTAPASDSGQSFRMWATARLDGTWQWSQPPKLESELPVGLVSLDVDESTTPAIISVGKGSITAFLNPSKNDWTTLEAPSSAHHGAGEGDLAVWTDRPALGQVRIRGWSSSEAKGVRTIVDPAPFDTCYVVPTPTHVVGFVDEQSYCSDNSPIQNARLWTSPRAYEQSAAVLTTSPLLPGTPFRIVAHGLKAWGDHAVLLLWDVDADSGALGSVYFLLVQLSTWKAWRVDPRPGFAITDKAWTLTDTHLYFGEHAVSGNGADIHQMIRVPLSEIGSFGKAAN